MRIIPAIDIIGGKCVRLTKGDYSTKKIYNEDPLEVALRFEDHGIEYLHMVDLDGAKSKEIVNYKILENIATKTGLIIDFGGGIKSGKDLSIAFECGAKQVTAGTVAVVNPSMFLEWLAQYGPDKLILGADCNNEKISVNGWQNDSESDVFAFIDDYFSKGVRYTICTDIAKDGMLEGASSELYRKILDKTKINLIASGGISSISDIEKMQEIGCEGTIIGKAIYENKISLKELQRIC
jgi:phosphoribosylformimino-5-aminoimidazole carboxamide ribotide isomerase